MTRVILFLLLAGLCALLITSCGHSRRMAATNLPGEVAEKAVAGQPEWLADALRELEAMPCPMNVRPEVFARIKARLREALIARAACKSVSSISQQYTRVRDLRWAQPSPEGPVYLTWGYVQGGDYDQNGVVNNADITPIAQNLGSTWNEGGVVPDNPLENGGPYNLDEYYSMSAVCDGNVDGVVFISEELGPGETDDIYVLAQSFNNRIAGYRILGSNATNPANAVQVATIAYGDHADIADEPYSMRLSYRVNVSGPELDQYAYYWVQPYDNTVPPNYGSHSDSDDILNERPRDDDPTNLLPTAPSVPQAVEGIVYGTCATELTLTYVPGDNSPLPITGQTWTFGGAAQGSQTSNEAMPTITLIGTADDYSATVKVTNAFGESATTPFTIQTTTDDLPPVVAYVLQSSFTPGEPATFTVIMAQGPGRTYLWDFGGGAWNGEDDTSTDAQPTMTLDDDPGYYDAWVEVSNQNPASPDPFDFQVRVGYPPTDVQVILPEGPIAVGEEVVFEATWNEIVSTPPLEFTWDFGLAHPDKMYGPLVAPTMTKGGSYLQQKDNPGYLTVSNPFGEVVVPFDFRVYWNELILDVLLQEVPNQDPKEDSLPGDDGYVTVVAEGHDLAYPLSELKGIYLEYNKGELACPEYAELDDWTNYPDEWNVGAPGYAVWYPDGWWLDYGTLYGLTRTIFFYDISLIPPAPLPSWFEERSTTHCSISVSVSRVGTYSSEPGDSGDFFSFRMYLARGVSLPLPYDAYINNYRLHSTTLLTYYEDDQASDRTFSNEPYVVIPCGYEE